MFKKPVDGEFKKHGISYRYEGSEWLLVIMATSQEDAMKRIRAAAMNGEADQGLIEIWMPPIPLWLARPIIDLITFLANARAKITRWIKGE